ncbi:DUF4276 family protein [Allochromatium palmeri]|uniref:DUF4276 family protein n=1 Tax=Allochromatium palmeri TaxID=231048 RepID=A0A6N8EHT3_9GAMM|nr:DUF4276 family protein [Allochromatium palmeri]MTW22276.1 DUF4276 family protein [Allochromatium palmeri]
MTTLAFCLEEASAKAMLQGVLPRLLPNDIAVHYIVFEGKQDMHKQLVKRLRFWQKPDTRFVVMRDQDSGDCRIVRQELLELCREAGREDALVRVACRELESFYLGDLQAVESGLAIKGLARQQGNRKFRDPDALVNASEELGKLTGKRYQKLGGSRRIGPHLNLDDGMNTSRSFKALIEGVRRVSKETYSDAETLA